MPLSSYFKIPISCAFQVSCLLNKHEWLGIFPVLAVLDTDDTLLYPLVTVRIRLQYYNTINLIIKLVLSISVITHSDICTKTSSLPSSGVMKPCPFSRQKDFILPYISGPFNALSDLVLMKQKISFPQRFM